MRAVALALLSVRHHAQQMGWDGLSVEVLCVATSPASGQR